MLFRPLALLFSIAAVLLKAQPIIQTIAGAGVIQTRPAQQVSFGLGIPSIAIDAAGNLYAVDSWDLFVYRINLATGKATIFAGTGQCCFNGDGQPATSANLYYPAGVTVDSGGNVIIVDTGDERVRRVSAQTGIITTVAGNGSEVTVFGSYSGDGGPATMAGFNAPRDLVVDSSGNIYIADTGNNRIRKVAAKDGTISTIAGTGSAAFGGDVEPATFAALNVPNGLAMDQNGNLFIWDSGNRRIRKMNLASGIIATIAGNGSATYAGDGTVATNTGLLAGTEGREGLAFDRAGDLFFTDGVVVREIPAGTNVITTVAGGEGTRANFGGDSGPATGAYLSSPNRTAVDSSGNVYIADSGNNRVRRVAAATGIISTVAGNGNSGYSGDGGPATNASLNTQNVVLQ